jgi:hypothetical protein
MRPFSTLLSGFFDELEKISEPRHLEVFPKEAAKFEKENRKAWSTSSARKGRRPMSVSTLLRKEKEGTLGGYKFAQVIGALGKVAHSQGAVVPFLDTGDPGQARKTLKPGEIPSRDDFETSTPKREDGRASAHTLDSPGTHRVDIAPTQLLQERST